LSRTEDAGSLGVFEFLVIAFFCVALIAGGSGSAPLSGAVVRIASIPVLGLALWRIGGGAASARAIWPGLIVVGVFGLLLVQRIPLPPDVWTRLPGRDVAADVYRAAAIPLPWLPISLTPHETWDATLGLLPAAAMFCAALTLNLRARWTLALIIVLMAVAAIGLGMLQVLGGEGSPLRFYAFTNRDSAVGFFANRNHQAALLVCAIPFAAAIAATIPSEPGPRSLFRAIAILAFALIIVVGIGVTRSRAGVLLLGPAFVGAVLIALRGRLAGASGRRDWTPVAAISAAIVLGVVLVATFSLTPLANRFQSPLAEDARAVFTPTTIAAGATFAPFGSGVGSFVPIYQTFERPETVTSFYANHAHNDYVEVWLEAGWAGVALVGLFVLWWAAASIRTLLGPDSPQSALALAGAVAVGALLAHSVVDYPLRTPALSTLFALACALMVPAANGKRGGLRRR
jgi:O-antigen ligase